MAVSSAYDTLFSVYTRRSRFPTTETLTDCFRALFVENKTRFNPFRSRGDRLHLFHHNAGVPYTFAVGMGVRGCMLYNIITTVKDFMSLKIYQTCKNAQTCTLRDILVLVESPKNVTKMSCCFMLLYASYSFLSSSLSK